MGLVGSAHTQVAEVRLLVWAQLAQVEGVLVRVALVVEEVEAMPVVVVVGEEVRPLAGTTGRCSLLLQGCRHRICPRSWKHRLWGGEGVVA